MPTIADFGNVANGIGEGGQGIMASRDGRYLFATSGRTDGGWNTDGLKHISVRGTALLGDLGGLGEQITTICN
jgi:hypothetical protein